ncbi:1,4-alpha-glucan branching protein [Peterkaempfera sp. SMS 1(5)a]|uniref:maltokinase N-terminal cap-like domain-containing protein n=1 Tax=Peterkaempfera podocarpi TaxID=3232308 RepID=UPI00366D14DE
MAVIHRTTLTPGKLELLADWLPTRRWYLGGEGGPLLTKAGGFRLDDPHGEVGIEFMAVTDESGSRPITYQVPLSYRGAPLDGAAHALIGTTEHGVLGRRWVYDGSRDPVLVAQLLALVVGEAEPQAQSTSDAPDPTVTRHFTGTGPLSPARLAEVADGPHSTDLPLGTGPGGQLTLRLNRVLRPRQDDPSPDAAQRLGHIEGQWLLPGGATARGLFAVVRDDTPRPAAGPAQPS